jgi:glutaredoxin-like protein NrdH
MTKALLSRRGVEFDALDVENDRGALEQLRALGFSSVPTVVVGDRSISGWNPTRLAELVGFALQEQTGTPDELLSSLRVILDGALRAVGQIPDNGWERMAPGRQRPLRELSRHLFHVVEAGVDADVLGVFPAQQWLEARDVPSLSGATLLTRYGEAVRAKLEAWYGAAPPDPARFARTIDADVGPRSLEQVLHRTRLHSGQHLRQVYAFLDWLGVTPDNPVTDDELRNMGLIDLPDELF